MRRSCSVVVLVLCGLWWARADASAQRKPRAPRIAVVVEGPSDFHRRIASKLAREVNDLLGNRYGSAIIAAEPTHVGDFTLARARALIDQVLADPEIDLVVAVGLQLGRAVGERAQLDKPVLLPFAIPLATGLPGRDGKSGRKNLAYLAGHLDVKRELRRFREVIRRDEVVVLLDAYLWNAIEGLEQIIADAVPAGMQVRTVAAGDNARAVLEAIPQDARAIYIGPLPRLPDAEIQPLIDGINARRLPSYASGGASWVELGAFTTLVAPENENRRVRRVALQIDEALQGADPAGFPVTFEPKEQLVTNMATARRIGVYPSFELMTEARLLGQTQRARGPELSLRKAVHWALTRGPSIAATRRDAQIARHQIDQAEGVLYPALDARAGFTWLDPDVASPVLNAERELSWGLGAQQLVFSPRAVPAVSAAKHARRSVDAAIAASELDVVRETALAYINLLRARTAEEINRNNLLRIRANLALAEARVEIGAGARQDVHRWQIEIADGRIAVIAANAARNQAEIALNRVLNRGLEEPMQLLEPTQPEAGMTLDERIYRFVEDPWTFRAFRDFMLGEAVRAAPEMRELDAAIATQHSLRDGRQQALYLPEVALSGQLSHTFWRGGTGADDVAGMERDDLVWQAGVGLSLPLFDMARYAELRESESAVAQLRDRRAAAQLAIQQRVLSTMHAAGASNAAVRLRRDAASAAAANLELAADAYREGAVDVITLIDAQNQALLTELAAANAVYDFQADVIEVERAAGSFGFMLGEAERNDFIQRLERYVARRRAQALQEATP